MPTLPAQTLPLCQLLGVIGVALALFAAVGAGPSGPGVRWPGLKSVLGVVGTAALVASVWLGHLGWSEKLADGNPVKVAQAVILAG